MIVSRSLLCRAVVVYDSLDASLRPPPYFFVHRLISPWALEKTSFLFSIFAYAILFLSLSHFFASLGLGLHAYLLRRCLYISTTTSHTTEHTYVHTIFSPYMYPPIAPLFLFFSSLPQFLCHFCILLYDPLRRLYVIHTIAPFTSPSSPRHTIVCLIELPFLPTSLL